MVEFHGEAAGSVDQDELARFARLGDAWWDPNGPQRALHQMQPHARALFKLFCAHFPDGTKPRDRKAEKPLRGLRVMDLGCGGGLLSKSLAVLGAQVTGADPSDENIAAARRHAAVGDLRSTTGRRRSRRSAVPAKPSTPCSPWKCWSMSPM